MNSGINFLKRAFGVGVFGIAVFFAASMTVNAQYRDNDSYYGRQNNRSYNRNQRTDKHHQKHEKQELKHHQRHKRLLNTLRRIALFAPLLEKAANRHTSAVVG